MSQNDYGTAQNDKLKSDWGNCIGNGWSTLTKDAWDYLLNSRTTTTTRYFKAVVNNCNGLVLLPDNMNGSYSFGNSNSTEANFAEISDEGWKNLESEGAVFLPAAGKRSNEGVEYFGTVGSYWSSSVHNDGNAYFLGFGNNSMGIDDGGYQYGRSVRLVHDF